MDSTSPRRENIDAALQRDPAARTRLEVFLTSPDHVDIVIEFVGLQQHTRRFWNSSRHLEQSD